MEASITKIIGGTITIITLAVILARSENFNSIIKQSGSTTTDFMKAAMGN